MCIYLNLMIFIKIIRGFLSTWRWDFMNLVAIKRFVTHFEVSITATRACVFGVTINNRIEFF